MVKRKRSTSRACVPSKSARAKYKKCILSAIRGTKISSAKGARKSFQAAAKKCGKLYLGATPRKGGRKKTRRANRRRRVTTIGGARGFDLLSSAKMSPQRRRTIRGQTGGRFI